MAKLWGGRFTSGLDPVMEEFNASISFDKRMYAEDIEASSVYAEALERAEMISESECCKMKNGLKEVLKEWQSNSFVIQAGDEDVHTANERRLKELIGAEIGGKLHTGRSRNDQVATDTRMWLRNSCKQLERHLVQLIRTLMTRSETEIDVIFPGYTHLQRAQPVLWSHWLLNYAEYFRLDLQRLSQLIQRINVCPLGSGALAGNPFNIDRQYIASRLEFESISANSMQAVGDRDFVAEFQFWSSLTAVHCSKLAEDLICYCSKEFGYVVLSDKYSTGSSLMPQKKNADSLELIRGKTGRMMGNCVGILTVLKGTPSTFNKDLQEDKEGMFDTFDTISRVLQITAGTVDTLTLNKEKCFAALSTDMLATDIAYYLVRKMVPFRNAHEIAGKVVLMADGYGGDLSKIPLIELKTISDLFDDDVNEIWNYNNSVNQYQASGGTSKNSVIQQINNLKKITQEWK